MSAAPGITRKFKHHLRGTHTLTLAFVVRPCNLAAPLLDADPPSVHRLRPWTIEQVGSLLFERTLPLSDHLGELHSEFECISPCERSVPEVLPIEF